MQITERKLRQIIRGVIIEEQINKRNRLLEEGYVLEEGKIGRMATGAVLAGLAFLAANGHITKAVVQNVVNDITGENAKQISQMLKNQQEWEKNTSREMQRAISGQGSISLGTGEEDKFIGAALDYFKYQDDLHSRGGVHNAQSDKLLGSIPSD